MRRAALLIGALCSFSLARDAAVAQRPLGIEVDGAGDDASLTVAVDADDDDDDGVPDAAQDDKVPTDGLLPFRFARRDGSVQLDAEGPVRVLRDGKPVALPTSLRASELEATYYLQGIRASQVPHDAALLLRDGGEQRRVAITVVGLSLLGADNAPLSANRDAVRISRAVTNDATLPRNPGYDDPSPGEDNIRIELFDPRVEQDEARVALEAVDPDDGQVRSSLGNIRLTRPEQDVPLRSPWIRLVGDRIDAEAPGVGDRLLRVRLRDIVRVRYGTEGGTAHHALRVGRPGDEDGPDAARRADVRLRILRLTPGGPPVIGSDEREAVHLARKQIAIANEIWLQCAIGFGSPEDADIEVVDPPPPSLLSVAEGDGLPARGGGIIRFRADGRSIGPVQTRAGDEPVTTALAIAGALRSAGLVPEVTENAPTEAGAGRSADVLIRRPDGKLATVEQDGEHPLSTDVRQAVDIGRVDLGDGVQEFDNMNATAGTLEERALLKAVTDDDPSTIDLVLVNRFTSGTRQGEAFIEGDAGAIVNTVLLDRDGLRQQRAAWTQSHEMGHVLLDQPFHPDNVGPDRPWLLMDADTSLPLVTGPKRLTEAECLRVRDASGVDAVPALLRRHDVRADAPRQVAEPYDQGYPRPER